MLLPKAAVQSIIAVTFLALAALAIHFLAPFSAEPSPALTKTYSNPAWGFMLKMPADLAAYPPNATPNRDETGAPTGQALLLQNKDGAMVQIEITPDTRAKPGTNLNVNDIAQSAPYFDLSQATPVEISHGVVGVTFTDTEHSNFVQLYRTCVVRLPRQPLSSDGRHEVRCSIEVDARHVDIHLNVCAERVTPHAISRSFQPHSHSRSV
jgi:hypothetical protein